MRATSIRWSIGTCIMRFKSAWKIKGLQTVMDGSSAGTEKSANNPNEVSSEVTFVRVGTDMVTVPAGTYIADKYTAAAGSYTATCWFVKDKPYYGLESGSAEGSAIKELNSRSYTQRLN